MSRRALRAVDTVSLLLALSALALAVWPVREGSGEEPTLPAALADASHAADERGGVRAPAVDSTAVGIVRGNVFSSTRRAPATRFMPPGSDASPAMADMSDVSSSGVDYALPGTTAPDSGGDAESGTRDPVPALYGIVGIDGVRHALLALRGGEPPRLFAVGDRHAGYRISAIERDRVVLATARGSRTLRLARSAPRDSSEIMP